MKFLTNKKIMKKIIILCVALLIFNFICPTNNVNAKTFTGMLVDPLIELLILIPASIYNLVQYFVIGEWAGVLLTFNDMNMELSPALIFSNNVPLLDINFINPKTTYTIKDVDGNEITIIDKDKIEGEDGKSIAIKATSTIGTWYTTLRYIAIIGLLIVLVYLGIKMLLTTVASKKAQYKQMLTDWFVALILVVTLHYFMAGLLTIVEKISEGLGSSTISVYELNGSYSDADMLESFVIAKEGYEAKSRFANGDELSIYDKNEGAEDDDYKEGEASLKLGYLVVFWVLVIYTFIFLFQYLKRVLYMAFLTIISPMVCLTYPIDKANDGSAQAFNMWFKEYVFNALIQPFHLLIYVVFMGIAKDINNVLITIVILGFMVPAEKFLRKMFGFDKATTNGAFLGAAAGSMVMEGIRHLGGGKGGPAPKGGASEKEDPSKIRVPKSDELKNMHAFKEQDNNSEVGAGSNRTLGDGNSDNEANDTSMATASGGINNEEEQRKELMATAGTEGNYEGIDTGNAQKDQEGMEEEQKEERERQTTADGVGRVNKQIATNPQSAGASTPRGNKAIAIAPQKNSIRRNIKGIGKRAGRWTVKKGLPGLGRTAARIGMGTLAGGAGLVAGALTGDPLKAFAFAATGATLGSNMGAKTFNKASGAVNRVTSIGKGAVDLKNELLHGEAEARNKRDEKELAKNKKEYMRSENTLRRARNFQDTTFAKSTLNADGSRMTEEQIAEKMYTLERAGITDDEDMKKAFLLEKKFENCDTEKAANIIQQAKRTSFEQLTDPTSRRNKKAKFRAEGLSEETTQEGMKYLDFIMGVDTKEADKIMNEKYQPKQATKPTTPAEPGTPVNPVTPSEPKVKLDAGKGKGKKGRGKKGKGKK